MISVTLWKLGNWLCKSLDSSQTSNLRTGLNCRFRLLKCLVGILNYFQYLTAILFYQPKDVKIQCLLKRDLKSAQRAIVKIRESTFFPVLDQFHQSGENNNQKKNWNKILC